MCKIDLRDAYFTIPVNQKYRKYLRFKWEGTLCQFICLCFGLGPAPLIFTKLMKLPISLLWRLNIRLIICLDDMLIMARSVQELIFHRDTVIYLLQNLGFVLNLKKSVLEPSQKIEFLGMFLDSMKMEITLPQEKLVKLMPQCKRVAECKEITIMDLTKLIGKLGSIAQAILPAQLQVRYFQSLQIQALKLSKCYHAKVHLDKDAKDEFFWWIENLRLYNRKSLILPPADLCISTDASTKGWGPTCQEISTGGPWSQEEQKAHINVLELKAAHLAILTFTKFQIVQRIHVQMDNKIALSYLVKMGGTHNKDPLGLDKQIWDYLQSKKITIRVPTRSFECDSRLRVPQFSRQERLETLPRSVCKNLSEIRYSQYRPFCIPDVSSTSSLHGQEARSGKSGNQCHVSTMDKNVLICISPIQSNTLGIIKGKERSDHNDIGDTNMAIASMIFSYSEHVYPQSVFVTTSEKPTSGPIRKTSSFSSKANSKIGGLVGFRK